MFELKIIELKNLLRNLELKLESKFLKYLLTHVMCKLIKICYQTFKW